MIPVKKIVLSLCLILLGASVLSGCTKDEVLDQYNNIVQSAGSIALTGNSSLQGTKEKGIDDYTGSYTANYEDFSDTEYLFGGTSIKREAGKDLSIDCALEVTDGTAKVFWISGADEEVTLLETTGTYSDTITLPEGGNYIGIECENFTSEILKNCQSDRVQDAYSLRCIPQVHGAIRDAIEYVKEKVSIELNAVTDNPLVFLDDENVISGGNFHGEPMALAFDFLGIACSEIADISERRTERMVNAALSNGLTPFLTTEGGVNSGYMIVQYSAASMVSENKVLAHPASVDSIPSSANQEDMVSMGTTAARKSGWIVQNTLSVLADELLTACQAIDIRRRLNTHGQGISPVHQKVYDRVRKDVAFYETDRELWQDIKACEKLVRSGELLDIVRETVADFE